MDVLQTLKEEDARLRGMEFYFVKGFGYREWSHFLESVVMKRRGWFKFLNNVEKFAFIKFIQDVRIQADKYTEEGLIVEDGHEAIWVADRPCIQPNLKSEGSTLRLCNWIGDIYLFDDEPIVYGEPVAPSAPPVDLTSESSEGSEASETVEALDVKDILYVGDRIDPGQAIRSKNGRYLLKFDDNGVVMFHEGVARKNTTAVWRTNVNPQNESNLYFRLKENGRLVLVELLDNGSRPVLWKSDLKAPKDTVYFAQLSNNGLLEVWRDGLESPTLIWRQDPNVTNLALTGEASQSNTTAGGDASRAIDGNTDGNWYSNSVTHTEGWTTDASWRVDFPNDVEVRKIVIHNRTDCCKERLTTFSLEIQDEKGRANHIYYHGEEIIDGSLEIDLPIPIQGRAVEIRLYEDLAEGQRDYSLSLAEVEVFGRSIN